MPESNASLIDHLIGKGLLKEKKILDAFQKVDRKDFVLEEDVATAYEDHPLNI